MSFLDIFRKKPKNWEVFKNFLIKDCYIPFNKLHSIEKATDTIISSIEEGGCRIIAVNGINDDDRFILQMAVATKAADAKYCTSLLVSDENKQNLIDALNQWKDKNCNINIGDIQQCKSKKRIVYINLFDKVESSQIQNKALYIYDASNINEGISAKTINI